MSTDLSSIFQTVTPSLLGKGEVKKREIILRTIEIGGQDGLEACTFDRIAKEVKSTRPLLNHYFKNRETLFCLAAEITRLKIQMRVVEKMKLATSSKELILNYISANLSWFEEDALSLRFYVQFLNFSSTHKQLADQNKGYVEMGLKRIEEIILDGQLKGEFHLSPKMTPRMCARNIQLQITGALVSLATENRSSFEIEIQSVIESCKLILNLESLK